MVKLLNGLNCQVIHIWNECLQILLVARLN